MAKPPTRRRARPQAATPATAGTERLLHAACVRAGAGAALQVALERLPLFKPFLPAAVRDAGSTQSAEDVQRALVLAIYRRYGLAPAAWEVEGVLAVAQTQAVLSPLATREGLRALLKGWIPEVLSRPLMRYTPLEPLVTATVRAVSATWAAGRYADSVCRLRQAGADWLPAPLASAMKLAPATLRDWSAEALSLAMPPLRIAGALGRRLAMVATAPSPAPEPAPRRRARKPAAKAPAKKKAAPRTRRGTASGTRRKDQ